MNSVELIKKLSDAFGPSGFEDDVVSIVKDELKDYYELEEDTLRNLRCGIKDTKKPTVMIDSHLDELGLMVQAIRPDGTIKFIPIGGWANVSLPSSKFVIKNKNEELVKAIVSSKPIHFMSAEERSILPKLEDMVLDCGSTNQNDTKEKYGIKIACPAVPDVVCEYDEENEMFLGKAFDNRIGVALEIELMKKVYKKNFNVNVMAAFSSQEEVGERGVVNNVNKIKPDIAIVFEGCPADDTFSADYMVQSAINKGPMLRNMDTSMITNPRFQKFAYDISKKYSIPMQESVRRGGGTDGAIIHVLDIPSIVIGVPVRYAHSSHCFVSLKDYNDALELSYKIIEEINEDIIKGF